MNDKGCVRHLMLLLAINVKPKGTRHHAKNDFYRKNLPNRSKDSPKV